jgi:hypothetical protein
MELVVPVVVLLLVLGVIAAGVVSAAPPAGQPQRPAKPASGRERRPAPPHPVRVRPLPPASRERYLAAWEGVRRRAAERPVLALSEADTIVARLLRERGLPEQEPRTAADRKALEQLPPQQRQALESYRAGHALEQANSSKRSDPEQVRQGMAHLQQAFRGLVEEDPPPYRDGPEGRPSASSEQRPRTEFG